MRQSVLCYRTAHSALIAANSGQEWEDRLPDLKDSDVRGPRKMIFIFKNQEEQIMEQVKVNMKYLGCG